MKLPVAGILARWIVPLVLACAAVPGAHAAPPQDPPMEWGVIPQEDLAMTSYPADTSAAALVLCDYGETTLSNNIELVFKRHTRVKILTTAGFDRATASILVYSHHNLERVRGIEGATYALDPSGQVVRTELEESSIFREEANEYYTRYRFSLPALRPGCVVEYRYTITTRALDGIGNWVFQSRIPVLWSEYRVMIPHQIVYAAVSNKRFPFAVDELKEMDHLYSGSAALYVGKGMAKCYRYRWVVKNSPALVDEPYVSRVEDYAQKMDLQLVEYSNWTDIGTQAIANSWEEAIGRLLNEEDFGGRLEVTPRVRDLSNQVTSVVDSPAVKMGALYDWVRKSIVWSGWRGIYSPFETDQVLEARKGSVSQIAFLLVSLLRSAGIEADPVVLSTRSNGLIQTTYPVLRQFDYVIVRAKIGLDSFCLDATDRLRPMDVLPLDVLKVPGLVIRKGTAEWIPVNSPGSSLHRGAARISIKEGGAIEGVLETADERYAALERRRDLEHLKPVEAAKKVFDADRSGLSIDSVRIEGEEGTALPVHIMARVSSPSYAQVSGDFIYVNPAIIDRQTVNPFRSEVRRYPVNIPFAGRSTSIVNLAVPAGYEVKELPGDQNLQLAGEDAVFTRVSRVDGDTVRCVINFSVNRTDFNPGSYADLRRFYERVTSCESEPVVLARKPAPPPKPVPPSKARPGSPRKR